jgi:hypothetical protein
MDSPVSVLYDSSANPLAVQNGTAIPASTPALMLAGSDGTNSRYALMDSSGRLVIVGAGTAGTPTGGVVSVQGVSGGQAVPVSGTVTATNPSVGTTGSAIPTSITLIGGSDGTNSQAARIFDVDTGAGTEFAIGVSIRLPGSGGSTAGGTSTNPIRVDPTGTTTQPISAASLPLPTGAATETTLASRVADSTVTARLNTLGQKTGANSAPVVLASDQAGLPLPVAGTATLSNVSSSAASVTLIAANANRKGLLIVNDSTKMLFAKFGATASATSYSVPIGPGALYTMDAPIYQGQIDGIWAAANGAARITEQT